MQTIQDIIRLLQDMEFELADHPCAEDIITRIEKAVEYLKNMSSSRIPCQNELDEVITLKEALNRVNLHTSKKNSVPPRDLIIPKVH